MDYDAIVVGAGPAGLTAATELAKTGKRVLVLDRESFGGRVMNTEWIEDYPRPGERTEGPKLGSQLVDAAAAGVNMELGDVVEVESYSGCRSVTTADGKAFTAPVLVVATGLRNRALGIPGEDEFQGKGMIHCAFCDSGLYKDRVVAVCGGGDSGAIEGLLLARHAAKVVLLESQAALTASPALQEQIRSQPKIEVRPGHTIASISGDHAVTGVEIREAATGRTEKVNVDGVLIQAGFEPATQSVAGALALDENGFIPVENSVTGAAGILAAGDVCAGSSRRAISAIASGQAAAALALKQL